MDLIIGEKYIPIAKTVSTSLEASHVWKVAKGRSQGYLFYSGKNNDGFHCFDDMKSPPGYVTGDFFNPSDVVPYIRNKAKMIFIRGEKYVPLCERLDGTVDADCELTHWEQAKAKGQYFLYYNGSTSMRSPDNYGFIGCIILGKDYDPGFGDFYPVDKVKAYQQEFSPDYDFLKSIWNISTEEQRKDILKKFPDIFNHNLPF